MRRYNAYIASIFLMISMLMICGCGSTLSQVIATTIGTQITARYNEDADILESLNAAGFVDETLYNTLKTSADQTYNDCIQSVQTIANDSENSASVLETNASMLNASTYAKIIKPSAVQVIKDDGSISFLRTDNHPGGGGDITNLCKELVKGDIGKKETSASFMLGNLAANYKKFKKETELITMWGTKVSDTTNGAYDNKFAYIDANSHNYKFDSYEGDYTFDDVTWDRVFRDGSKAKYKLYDGTEMKTDITPLSFIGTVKDINKMESLIDDKFRLPVYVLDIDKVNVQINTNNKTIDEIIAAVQTAASTGDTTGLSNYFSKSDITLMPVSDNKDETFKITKLSEFPYLEGSETKTDPNKRGIGYDIVCKQDVYCVYKDADGNRANDTRIKDVECLGLCVYDFDPEAIALMKEVYNMTNDTGKYIFGHIAGEEAVILVQYPISVVSQLDTVEISGNKYARASFNEDTGLEINLAADSSDGNLVVYDKVDSTSFSDKDCHHINESYLTAVFSQNAEEAKKSSFIVQNIPVDMEIKYYTLNNGKVEETSVTKNVPRIILRDYLEATWAPGVVDNENVVIFGRKIRLDMSADKWKTYDNEKCLAYQLDTNAKIAYYVDYNGNIVGSLSQLTIYDICNGYSLYKYYTQNQRWDNNFVLRFKRSVESEIDTHTLKKCTADSDNDSPKIDELAVKVSSTGTLSNLSFEFPGNNVGKVDETNTGENISRFYCICTTKGMFDSALYSDWINSTSTTASLAWWNDWLEKHGYVYRVENGDIEEYLSNNYRYELSQDGAVILDLNTVAEIQDIYDKEEGIEHAKLIRTIFIVLGYIILAYSMILMLCWIVDTHTDLGLSIVNKLTFGHWTAVAYESDLPSQRQGDKSYVDGKHMFIRCIILVFIAIILIIVDVNKIILVLVEHFGELAKKLNDIIQGVGH